MKLIGMIVLLMILILFADPGEYGTVHGFVFDQANKESIIGANVYLEEITLGGVSNLSGYYVIPQIPPGEYTLICEYMGYKQVRQQIKIVDSKKARLDIYISQEILEGKTITVVAESIRTSEKLFLQPISKVELTV